MAKEQVVMVGSVNAIISGDTYLVAKPTRQILTDHPGKIVTTDNCTCGTVLAQKIETGSTCHRGGITDHFGGITTSLVAVIRRAGILKGPPLNRIAMFEYWVVGLRR